MKVLALAASGLLTMLPCERPPIEYQGESVPARVIFAHPAVVDAVCKQAAGIPVADPRLILACTNPANSTILMPDPCLFDDGYSALLCHEKSHLRRADGSPGWTHAAPEIRDR